MSSTPSFNSGHRILAFSIIGLCLLALVAGVVGLFVRPEPSRARVSATEEASADIPAFLESSLMKQDHLLLIRLEGPIMGSDEKGGFLSNDSMAMMALKALNYAEEEDAVKGVLLAINSPGGTVGMSQELNAAVKRVREKKPVYAAFLDMAASGGYYTACAADKIYSNPGTLTASIGVIISGLNFKDLMTQKLGVKAQTYKSGKFKDILSPYRDPVEGEGELIQGIIMDAYDQFIHEVVTGRTRAIDMNQKNHLPAAEIEAKLRAVADGRIVSGRQGVQAGLVDEIGDLYVAQKGLETEAKKRFNMKDKKKLPFKEYSKGMDFLSKLGIQSLAPLFGLQTKASLVPEELVPMSVRYPNQPLWMYE